VNPGCDFFPNEVQVVGFGCQGASLNLIIYSPGSVFLHLVVSVCKKYAVK